MAKRKSSRGARLPFVEELEVLLADTTTVLHEPLLELNSSFHVVIGDAAYRIQHLEYVRFRQELERRAMKEALDEAQVSLDHVQNALPKDATNKEIVEMIRSSEWTRRAESVDMRRACHERLSSLEAAIGAVLQYTIGCEFPRYRMETFVVAKGWKIAFLKKNNAKSEIPRLPDVFPFGPRNPGYYFPRPAFPTSPDGQH